MRQCPLSMKVQNLLHPVGRQATQIGTWVVLNTNGVSGTMDVDASVNPTATHVDFFSVPREDFPFALHKTKQNKTKQK
ncbi:hypothetical protein L1987_37973 [Smallanthus sonchifolius]|uniref:Uncharacterized protein n=1 Tax=Smallanthus sonchifolius TaxID=185202 RepID=A0ACB9HHS6_9ASTR|nr:hypothetical protein L1987_37973 [Smallanthus sonchifolius]